MPSQFVFDPSISPESNIERFFEDLGSDDQQFADLLRENIQKLIPLPEGPQRQTIRQSINATIRDAIAAPQIADSDQ
jgi:hypothetical protein